MKKFLLFALILTSTAPLFAQTTLTLTFNGRDQNNARVQLDNVVIQNVTRGWTEAIFFPDTIYTLTVGTGVADYLLHSRMQVMPNPFDGRTQVNIHSAKAESVTMTLVDINGKRCAEYKGILSDGNNYFEIELVTPQTYILSVQTSEGTRSLKMVNTGNAGRNQIKEAGVSGNAIQLKSTTAHTFELGDEMRYTGYSQQSIGLIPSTPITQNQYESEAITLHFTLENDAELPIVATVAASNIGMNTATTGGNVFSDGGAPVTARGVCYSVTPNPTLSESHTTDGSGTGAFTSTLTNLVESTTYYVRAYATNSAGTAYGNEVSFTTEAGSLSTIFPCAVPSAHPAQTNTTYHGNGYNGANHGLETVDTNGMITSVTDYDGNEYSVVQIGSQCWLAENMRCTHSAITGTYIVDHSIPSNSNYTYTGKQARWYTGTANLQNGDSLALDSATCVAHHLGLLYNWNAAVDVFNNAYDELNINPNGNSAVISIIYTGTYQGICPKGWHVPSDMEWTQLMNYVSSIPAYWCNGDSNNIAKALASTTDWLTNYNTCAIGNNPSTNNATGFSAMPAGIYSSTFALFGEEAQFWSSTENTSSTAWYRGMDRYFSDMSNHNGALTKNCGMSVRCLRDEDSTSTHVQPTTTLSVSDTIFLPDGKPCLDGQVMPSQLQYCSAISSVAFTGFTPLATIQSANDILYVRINIEHSYIGDLWIRLICPNQQFVSILKKKNWGTSDCSSQIPATEWGWNGNGMGGAFLGDPVDDSGGGCTLTPMGHCWNYCWSNATNQDYVYSNNYYVYSNATDYSSIDSTNTTLMTNVYHPDNSFDNLIGCPINGTWSIEIMDGYSIDNGYLCGWEISISPSNAPQTTSDQESLDGDLESDESKANPDSLKR